MSIIEAIIMGLVQGIGEFLPISSSAHLVLVPWLFKWPDPGLTFDVGLHIGTLIAVLAFFWKDWIKLLKGAFSGMRTTEGRLFWFLVLATIPGAAVGFALESKAETVFRTPELIAIMLIIMGLILYWADRRGKKEVELEHIKLGTALTIGLSQALAIIPGVSRSGVTMTAALLLGLKREEAARFSFLLSTPIIFGAGIMKVPDVVSHPELITTHFMIGIVVSAIAGLLSIGFLLKFLQTRNFLPFAWYRFILGAVVLAVAIVR
ncbi:MAG: undecaprenyl-diphosphatase UppP [Methylocystaceae bacterium]